MAESLIITEEIYALLQTHKSWNRRISFLYKKEIMADCYIVINEGEDRVKIPAHKFVLSACSRQFYNLFFLVQSENNESIFINDFSVEIVDKFLKFVYNNTENMSMDEVWEILRISRFYEVDHIMKKCGDLIMQQLTDVNVFTFLNKAIKYELPTVQERCLNLINQKTVAFLQNPSFLQLNRISLHQVLMHDNLPGKEIEIYRCVISWIDNCLNYHNIAISTESRRKCSAPILNDIRFGAMTIEEFTECAEDQFPILTDEQQLSIFKFFGAGGRKACPFSNQPRTAALPPAMFLRIINEPIPLPKGRNETVLQFSCNQDILFCGVGVYSRRIVIQNAYLTEEVSVRIKKNSTLSTENAVKLFHDGSNTIHNVFLKTNFLVEKSVIYELTVIRHGGGGFFWGGLLQHEVESDGVVVKMIKQETSDCTIAGLFLKNV